ncbi:peptidyl-tRNA hydrolase, PTH2 family [Enteropsectra breve]|nr:peptidyl-tRNA hydrolase, PTH2 family [Enteropsectra breve]
MACFTNQEFVCKIIATIMGMTIPALVAIKRIAERKNEDSCLNGKNAMKSKENIAIKSKVAQNKKCEENIEGRIVLMVNKDLKMGKGKIISQAAHALCGLHINLQRSGNSCVRDTRPLVLRAEEDEMRACFSKIFKRGGLPVRIFDAGRTQIAPNSHTVLAFVGSNKDDFISGKEIYSN